MGMRKTSCCRRRSEDGAELGHFTSLLQLGTPVTGVVLAYDQERFSFSSVSKKEKRKNAWSQFQSAIA